MANKNFEVKHGLSVGGTERITAAGAGALTNLTLTGNLTVQGTTVTLDASTLQVADKNIVLNYHASNDTSSSADGAGITIQDAVDASNNATINWSASNDRFDFSHKINIPTLDTGTITNTGNLSMATDNATIYIGADLDLRLTHSGSHGTITNNTGNLTLDVAGNIVLDADGSHIVFADAGTEFGRFSNESTDLVLYSLVNDKDIILKGITGGSSFAALTLDMSVGGQLKAAPLGVSTPTFAFSNDSNTGMTRPTGDTLQLVTGGTQALRIDSSQNVLVGKSASGVATAGHEFFANGTAWHTRASGNPIALSRLTNDGNILEFYRASTLVAAMGVVSTDNIYIVGSSGGTKGIYLNDAGILPAQSDGTVVDNAVDLGQSGYRFKNLYLSGAAQIAGSVGIGTASPSYKLDVYGTDDITMRIHRPSSGLALTDTCGIGFSHRGDANTSTSDTRAGIFSTYNGSLHLCTEPGGNLNSNPVDHSALTIDGTVQNVGIGTTSPAARLHISGNSDVSDADCQLIIDDVDGSAGSRIPSIQFRSNTGGSVTNQGRIRATDTQGMVLSGSSAQGDDLVVQAGKVGIGTTSPDYNLEVEFAAGNHTTGAAITNSQAGGYGSALNFVSERSDNNAHTIAARIRTEGGDSWNTDASTDSTLKFETVSANALATKMTIKHDGLVGIGTESPQVGLHVYGANNSAGNLWTAVGPGNVPSICIQNAGTTNNNMAGIFFRDNADMRAAIHCRFISHSSGDQKTQLRFSVATGSGNIREKMTLTEDGHLLVGQDTAVGSGSPSFGVFGRTDSNATLTILTKNDGYGYLNFADGHSGATADPGYIRYNHNNNDLYTNRNFSGPSFSSDVSRKENITDITDGWSVIKDLRPRAFDWKKDELEDTHLHGMGTGVAGFIAQELETVLPNEVHGVEGEKGIAPFGIIAYLVKTVQELEARIKTLEG
jgi:hypothetical protein